MYTFYYITLVPMVYAAFAVFVLGSIFQAWRIIASPRHATPLGIYPSKKPRVLYILADTFTLPTVRRNNPVLWVFLLLFHVAFLLLILGHFELIADIGVLQVIEHEVFLGGGIIGAVLFVALLFFLARRFHSPYRELSVPEDYYLLILLMLTVLFGSQLHLARSMFDYSSVALPEYREYLSSMVNLSPALPSAFEDGDVGHSFLLVLHVFFANLFLMVFPWSKIMHSFLALPLNKLRRSHGNGS